MEPLNPDASIGKRIAHFRERRGIEQAALAGRVGKSRSWLCQIESGARQIDRFGAIIDLARELRVDPWELTGHRGDLAPDGAVQLHPAIPAIRAALDTVTVDPPGGEPSVAALSDRVRTVWDDWFTDASRFDATGELLPGLLVDVKSAVHALEGSERRAMQRQLSLTYQLIRMFAKRVGSLRDALRAADRAIVAAQDAGDLPLVAAGMWNLAVAHSSMGEVEQAGDVARQAAEMLRPGLPDASAEHMSMWGQIHLIQAVSAARVYDKTGTWDCLETAERAARRTGERNDFWTAFGPTNVRMHAVNAAVEIGEPGEALHAAREVDPSVVPSVERRFSHEMEIAAIYGQRRDDEACLFALLHAEQVSPHNARYSISMKELSRDLLRRESRLTHRAQARGLAHRVGVLTF